MAEVQTLANHRKFVPFYHYMVLPVMFANFVWVIVDAFGGFSVRAGFNILVAFSLLMMALYVRVKPTKVQDRIIRNEERERMRRLFPPDMQGDIDKLSTGQLVGMRFASDEELPDLAKKALTENLGQEDVKKHIKTWRPDHQRV